MSREWTRIGRNYLPAFRTSSTAFITANLSRHSSQSATWVLSSWDSSSGRSFSSQARRVGQEEQVSVNAPLAPAPSAPRTS